MLLCATGYILHVLLCDTGYLWTSSLRRLEITGEKFESFFERMRKGALSGSSFLDLSIHHSKLLSIFHALYNAMSSSCLLLS